MINVFGTIEWNKPSGMKDFLESYPDIFGGFYPFKWGGRTVQDDEAIWGGTPVEKRGRAPKDPASSP